MKKILIIINIKNDDSKLNVVVKKYYHGLNESIKVKFEYLKGKS